MSVRSLTGIGMCALVSLLGSNAVFAQGPAPAPGPTPTVQERLEALEKKSDAPSLWKTLGFKASGAVDVAYTHNFNNPSTNLNQGHIFDTNASSFMPHLVQVMVERPADAGGSALERAGFRARLNFGVDSRVTRARTNYQPGVASDEMDFQELYAEYILPIGNGLKVQAGKMNTLIGYEVIQSWENPNFSRTFMFGLGQAFTTTGIRFSYTFNPMVTASIGLINGWDNVDDNNKGKSIEWLVALTPHERFGISFYGSHGPEQSNNQGGSAGCVVAVGVNGGCDASAKRTVVGSIITAKLTDKDTVVLEPYYGNEENASGTSKARNARWNGLGAYLIHDFSDQWSVRLRGEIFEDAGGTRVCTGSVVGSGTTAQNITGVPGGWNTCAAGVFPSVNGITNTGAQTLWETTYTLQYKPMPNLITRAEFRYDKSNRNIFLNGNDASNNQETLSFQVVYLF